MPLSPGLVDRVLRRIGVSADLDTDLAGLGKVYAAWCGTIPFDNTAKLIAIGRNAPAYPGIDAEEFFERYLRHGVGGTCWPSSNALCELLISLGFNARRSVASMRDTGIKSHGTVKVRIGESDWLADSSMLTNDVLPLGTRLFVGNDPVFPVEIEVHDGNHVVWWHTPPSATYMPCRILIDEAQHDFYVERYEASRERSPFNERIYARRNVNSGMLIVTGNRRLFRTREGVSDDELGAHELERCLGTEMGFSRIIMAELKSAPAWEASFRPPTAPPSPPPERERPSLRNTINAGLEPGAHP